MKNQRRRNILRSIEKEGCLPPDAQEKENCQLFRKNNWQFWWEVVDSNHRS